MNRGKPLYEGKAKTIYEGPEPGTLIQYFKDDGRVPDHQSEVMIAGKGVLNNRISAHIMTKLEAIGVPTHFMRSLNMREQLVRKVEIIPLQIVLRNVAAGEICDRLGVKEGHFFQQPLVELYYKNEKLNNPLVSEQHILTFHWADPYELEEMVFQSLRINDFLMGMFTAIGLRLTDFKLEFGRLWGDNDDVYIMLADEISPDNCSLLDAETNKPVAKDEDASRLVEQYQDIAKRLGLIPQTGIIHDGNINEAAAEGLDEIENELAKHRRLRSIKKSPKR